MKENGLVRGKCCIKENDDESFIKIEQNGREFHYRFKRSQNGKFMVVWQMSLNPLHDKNKQVCLIESGNSVLWCEEFEIVNTCEVSNNGTVVALVHYWFPAHDIDNRPGFIKTDSIIIVPKDRDKFQLKFSERDEIVALAISQDGVFLIYNLQRYRPDDYQLILYNIHINREEWRYKYPRKQVVHEVVFKDDHILVYAGPRPSAYVDRRYSFTLDLTGKVVQNDFAENQKQEEKDSLAAVADGLADQVIKILLETLAEIAPTIQVTKRREYGTRIISPGMSSIMSGRCPLPALHIMITPYLHQFFAEPNRTRAKIEEQGCHFFFNIQVVARNAEERDKTSNMCIQKLIQQKDNLEKKGLIIATRLRSDIIGRYPGSGPYLRTAISSVLIFPKRGSLERRS